MYYFLIRVSIFNIEGFYIINQIKKRKIKMIINKINFGNPQNTSVPKNRGNFYLKNSLSFSSQFLYKANIKQILKNGEERFVPVNITRFIPEDPSDVNSMTNAENYFSEEGFFSCIKRNFAQNMNNYFLALEINSTGKKPKNKIIGLAEVTSATYNGSEGYNDLEVMLMQSGKSAEKESRNRKYKGAGELLLYGICKLARDLGFSEVTLNSTNDEFYDHINMPKAPDLGKSYYAFKKNIMDKFIQEIKKKYSIKDA